MRRRWILLGALLALGIGLTSWRLLRDQRPARRHATTKTRLDVAAFRTQLALRVKRAREVAARRVPVPVQRSGDRPRSRVWAVKGKGASKIVDRFLFEPECWIGSREVCASLVPLVDECYAGDARTCLAVGQYLADNPPRALMAMMFFYQACRIGDEAGCERIDDLEADARGDCAEDPWACGWRAYKKQDMDDLEESCALGATESCTWLAWNTDDLDAERAYLEQACQLANRAACADLATRLSADCDADSDDHEETHCLPIDEEGAAAAKRMACEAGWLGC